MSDRNRRRQRRNTKGGKSAGNIRQFDAGAARSEKRRTAAGARGERARSRRYEEGAAERPDVTNKSVRTERGQMDAKSAGVKSPRRFGIKMQKKLVVLYLFVLLAFAGLCVRLVWIINEDGDKYTKQVLSQRGYDSQTIPFRRGDILDSNGNILATSEKVYNLVTDSTVMLYEKDENKNPVNLDPTVEALEQYFGLSAAEVREYTVSHPESAWKVWLKQLTYDEIKDFREAQNADKSKIKGVWFEEEYKRRYPYNSLASDVIGFTGRDNTGSYGLEEYYNDILNGTTGRKYGYLNSDSNLETKIKPAVDGYTIHTTIDAYIQQIMEKYINQFMDERQNRVREGDGAENVGAIVMEVDTGRILGMASSSQYDLNNPRDYSKLLGNVRVEEYENANGYIEIRKTGTVFNESTLEELTSTAVDEETQKANEHDLYVNLNYLWKNFCISDTYEPGSTAKPFTVAAALEAGAITGNEWFTCNGVLVRGGHSIKCHGGNGHGSVSVQNSIAWSCNMALIQIAEKLGIDGFVDFQKTFNFGLKTNIDLTGEARTASLVFSAEGMKNDGSALATNSFGQGFNVTMIQMITAYSALVNGGYYYQPHMVDKITNASGATVQNIEPRVLKQVVSESTSNKILKYTRATVMEEGGSYRTGKTARPAGYAIGGKTGTAQTQPRGNGEYVVSFMGHAPADDPKIAIYVVVDRANEGVQADAKYATGIVRNILTEILPYLQIYMTEDLTEEEQQELDALHLANTQQYTQTIEGNAVENPDEGEEEPPAEGENTEPEWKSYPQDPETGYLKNPTTGELVDPATGDVIDPATGNASDDNWESLPDGMNNNPDGNGEPAGSPL